MFDNIYEEVKTEVTRAFLALDEPVGSDVNGDYGRADGCWHRELGTSRMLYAVELPYRPSLADEPVRRYANEHGFGLVMFDTCEKCRKSSALLPVYSASGGFAGKCIFYLIAPAPQFPKASQ